MQVPFLRSLGIIQNARMPFNHSKIICLTVLPLFVCLFIVVVVDI